jgi:hypothetical protein
VIVQQFREFTNTCFLLKEILANVHSEHKPSIYQSLSNQHSPTRLQEGQSFEIKVKEQFQLVFLDLILGKITSKVIVDDDFGKLRTHLQYLIEMLSILDDKSIGRLTFSFFFNKSAFMNTLYQKD